MAKTTKINFLVISIWVLVIFGMSGFYNIFVFGAGYNTKIVTTTNSSGSIQTNYPLEINISTSVEITAGRMRSDCGDIRVLNSDQVTQLNYAVVNCNTTFTSVVYVVPSLLTGATRQFITFGDPLLISNATPNSVFDIYEMFSNVAPSCTLGGSGPATWDAVNQWLRLTSNLSSITGHCNYNFVPAGVNKGYKALFQIWAGPNAGTGADAIWQYGFDSTIPTSEDVVPAGVHYTFDELDNRMCFQTSPNNTVCDASSANTTLDNSTWRSMEISWDSARRRIFENGANRINTTVLNKIPITTNTNFGLAARTSAQSNEHRVRQFAVLRFSETITGVIAANSRPSDNLGFSIRNPADTAAELICDLGDVTSAAVASCQYRLKVISVATNGYSIQLNTTGSLNSPLYGITNAIAGSGGGGGSPITAGSEIYGANITPGLCTNGTITPNSVFQPTTGNITKFDYTTAVILLTCSGGNQPNATDLVNTTLINHQLAVSGATPAGYYAQSITWTVTPNY